MENKSEKPVVVCLCGSTRFSAQYREANLLETLAGRIVLSIGCDMRSDAELFADKSEDELTEINANWMNSTYAKSIWLMKFWC